MLSLAISIAYLVLGVDMHRVRMPSLQGVATWRNVSGLSLDQIDKHIGLMQRSQDLTRFLLAAHQPHARRLPQHGVAKIASSKARPRGRSVMNVKQSQEALRRREMLVNLGLASAAIPLATQRVNALEEESLRELQNSLDASAPSPQPLDTAALIANAEGAATIAPAIDIEAILQKSAKKALGSGKAGASAAVVQVCSLMWLRTAMNYQYRYGGNLSSALNTLMNDGGIARLYKGLPFALVQGPLSRFGDTATNIGVFALLESFPETVGLPLPVKTAAASLAAGLWRILCMPIDTSKTALQVEGEQGLENLKQKVLREGPAPLYRGSIASAVATFAGNYPWFLTYNFLDSSLPLAPEEDLLFRLLRSAFQGFAASAASDTVSNGFRVVKTTQQTAALEANSTGSLSIPDAFRLVLEQDGVKGLLGRGLKTRLLTNAIQGAAFSVLWKYFQMGGPTGPV